MEDDMKALEEMYPQGEQVRTIQKTCFIRLDHIMLYCLMFCFISVQAETVWALTVLGYLAKFVLGVVGYVLLVFKRFEKNKFNITLRCVIAK